MIDDIPKQTLFKWIGGKTWLKDDINEQLNKIYKKEYEKMDRYIEPFIGGLGSFKIIYNKISNYKNIEIVLNDINTLIINTFKNVKEELEELLKEYKKIESEFNNKLPKNKIKCKKRIKNKKTKEIEEIEGEYYYYELNKTLDKVNLKELYLKEARDYFNLIKKELNHDKLLNIYTIKTSARFLFIMNHCFNGVYRENKKGEYNVPFNWDNKKIDNNKRVEIIKKYNKFFNNINVVFENMDVFNLIKKYKTNKTFIYLDPPYVNEKENENKYNKDSFTNKKQKQLIEEIEKDKYIYLYSNHNVSIIKEFFDDKITKKYNKKYINRKNIMSSSNKTRSEDKEEILVLSKK